MTLEQAERLVENEDFKAFISLLNEDAEQIKGDLVYQVPEEMLKVQMKIQTIRSVTGRLAHLIESLRPEEPATDQVTAY